jgi:hypothetical protein
LRVQNLFSGWWSGVTLHTLHVFSHTRHLGVWHRLPLLTAVLRHWHFQQVLVSLLSSSIQPLGPLLCCGVWGRLKWVWRASHSVAVPGKGFHIGLSSSMLCAFFMFHIFFDISVVICERCSGPLTCTRQLGRCFWSTSFMYPVMLCSCCWVSWGGFGEAVWGSFAQDHGMVCFCGAVWVSVGQSTSSRYACSVALVCAGRVLMVGMVVCHCCVALPLAGRSAWGIWIGVRRLVRQTVLWFARHRCGPASLRARSSSHRRSHVLSGMSSTPRCWRVFLPRVFSSCFLSSRRGLVAAAHPNPWGLWPSMLWKEVSIPVYLSHAARRSQILSRVSSHSLTSASCMSSVQDRHSQACLALARTSRRIAHVVSSCLVHLAMWAWRV